MREKDAWEDIANYVFEHPAGNAPALREQLTVTLSNARTGGPVYVSESEEILIRRSFWDCKSVQLLQIDEGNSGVRVYQAYPMVGLNLLKGKWLLPHFVKIGQRRKIFSEYENYVDAVHGYVPFHLGPHLVPERCCLGAKDGIIVGDWIEESESLRDCARSGRAAAAIACLFDRTLHGWYRSAEAEYVSVAKMLRARFPTWIGAKRWQRAQELGATRELGKLHRLFRRCNGKPILVGPIHGDLHASNVRVRATDAIVIDFYSHDGAPLLYDFACLEASLLVEGFDESLTDTDSWLASVESLYQGAPDMAPPHADPCAPSCWFHSCVRQIRHHAQRVEKVKGQYAGCLALALLVKATKDLDVREPESSRRAAAYLFAERILSGAFDNSDSAKLIVPKVA